MPTTFVTEAATVQAQAIWTDWIVFTITGLIVALIVWALILFPVVRWRRRGTAPPPQFRRNDRMAIVYLSVPLVLVLALFALTYQIESVTDATTARPGNAVEVTGYRWGWRFRYPRTGIVIDGAPNHPPELVLPTGTTTRVDITSVDVNHAFWVPAFGFKRDAIPGVINHVDFTPVRLGSYFGECGEFCGLEHANMPFVVRIVSPRDYAAWSRDRKKGHA